MHLQLVCRDRAWRQKIAQNCGDCVENGKSKRSGMVPDQIDKVLKIRSGIALMITMIPHQIGRT